MFFVDRSSTLEQLYSSGDAIPRFVATLLHEKSRARRWYTSGGHHVGAATPRLATSRHDIQRVAIRSYYNCMRLALIGPFRVLVSEKPYHATKKPYHDTRAQAYEFCFTLQGVIKGLYASTILWLTLLALVANQA